MYQSALARDDLPGTPSISPSPALAQCVREYLRLTPQLPNPGAGRTYARWQALSRLGAASLPLAKVLEAHYDAVSIFPRPASHCLRMETCGQCGQRVGRMTP